MKKILILLIALTTFSCDAWTEFLDNYEVRTYTGYSNIQYRYGQFGWGAYDNFGRFYPSTFNNPYGYQNYWGGPRIIIAPQRRNNTTTTVRGNRGQRTTTNGNSNTNNNTGRGGSTPNTQPKPSGSSREYK